MLLATYALVTLTIEQMQERQCIYRLQQSLAMSDRHQDQFDCSCLASEFEHLIMFAESRHRRRLETCLFPALREISAEASDSLSSLENLGRAGRAMLPRIRRILRPRTSTRNWPMPSLYRSAQAYCQNLLARLACEECELLPLAQRILSSDAWFRIGAQFLLQDAQQDDPRPLLQLPA